MATAPAATPATATAPAAPATAPAAPATAPATAPVVPATATPASVAVDTVTPARPGLRVVRTAAELSADLEAARRAGRTVGLVPTMGALHEGHRSLIDRAVLECDHVAVTVFVNPLQFDDRADLDAYPHTLAADVAVASAAGATVVFAPTVEEMYPSWPDPPAATVSVGGLTERWEGAARPGHFDGVTTVVAKLFALAGRCRAYFGEKDFQQLAVVRRMATDLSLPVEVVGCPTVRETDGLALSSRNARLSPPQRAAATVLWRALAAGRRAVAVGEHRPEAVAEAMARVVAEEPEARLDYAAAVDAADLTVPGSLASPQAVRLLVAARVGPVRLIDNCAAGRPAADRRAADRPAAGRPAADRRAGRPAAGRTDLAGDT